MSQPRVLILRSPGTNCDEETAHAFELAGAAATRVHVNRLLETPSQIADYQILCAPGGFSYGDDLAAGRILGVQLRRLGDVLRDFRDAGKLVLGVCNGFQVLMRSGLLLKEDDRGPLATLTWNRQGRYEDRWVRLAASGDCPFLAGVTVLSLPIAHAEGRLVPRDEPALAALRDAGRLVLRYTDENGQTGDAPLPFPANPNGSAANVAGICDKSGRVLGLMPHPERFVDFTHHPQWTRRESRGPGDGLLIFQNAVAYFR
jgi:phosphoribosylformylglycinamidine synthase